MFRCYDKKNKKWVKNFYIMPNGEMFVFEKKFFKKKLSPMSNERYVVHMCTGARDMLGNIIYEGDIITSVEDEGIICVIAYNTEHCCFYAFDDKHSAYYGLIDRNRETMRVIGNVFDNQDLLNHDESTKESLE